LDLLILKTIALRKRDDTGGKLVMLPCASWAASDKLSRSAATCAGCTT